MDIKQAIIDVISEQKISTQSQLVGALKKKGFQVEQSTVSRQFKKLDVYKALDNNEIYYKIMQKNVSGVKGFVKSVVANEAMIVIQTKSGAANMVGDFVDNLNISSIIGTIAGDNTIFVTTDSVANINQTCKVIKDYLT